MSFLAGGILGSLGAALGKRLGKGDSDPFGMAKEMASLNAGVKSSLQGPVFPGASPAPAEVSGSQVPTLGDLSKDLVTGLATGGVEGLTSKVLADTFNDSPSKRGKDSRAYLQAQFPELNPWELAGSGGTSAGIASASLDNQKELQAAQLKTQEDIAKLNAETELKKAGIASATSRQNTQDQVYVAQAKLDTDLQESEARIGKLISDRNVSDQTVSNLIVDEFRKRAEVTGQHLSNDQIRALTDKVRQDIHNNRFGTTSFARGAADAETVNSAALGKVDSVLSSAKDWYMENVPGARQWSDALESSWNFYSRAGGVTGASSRK